MSRFDVCIVGGGAVGISTAYFLQKAGLKTILLERDSICRACSFGNAGLIVPSHILPLAAPGVLSKGLSYILHKDGPLKMTRTPSLDLVRWLYYFAKNCTQKNQYEKSFVLSYMANLSTNLYASIAQELKISGLNRSGVLMLFAQRKSFHQALQDLKLWEKFGVDFEIYNSNRLGQFDSRIKENLAGGIYLKNDACIEPLSFFSALAKAYENLGGTIHDGCELSDLSKGNDESYILSTSELRLESTKVVVAAGVWSKALLKKIGINIPIQGAKGYSITGTFDHKIKTPMIFEDARVIMTPLGKSLRLSGFFELKDFDLYPCSDRVLQLKKSLGDYLQLPIQDISFSAWAGLRPCSPDGLPILGELKSHPGIFLNCGHSMLGITLAPGSAKILSDLIIQGHSVLSAESLMYPRAFPPR